MSDGDLPRILLVHGRLPLLDVEFEDGYGQPLLVDPVHTYVRKHHEHGGVGPAVVQDPCGERRVIGIQPIRVGDGHGPVSPIGGAVYGDVQTGISSGGIRVPVIVVPGGQDAVPRLVEGDECGAPGVIDAEFLHEGSDVGIAVVVVAAVHLIEESLFVDTVDGIERCGHLVGQPFE